MTIVAKKPSPLSREARQRVRNGPKAPVRKPPAPPKEPPISPDALLAAQRTNKIYELLKTFETNDVGHIRFTTFYVAKTLRMKYKRARKGISNLVKQGKLEVIEEPRYEPQENYDVLFVCGVYRLIKTGAETPTQ